MRLRVSLHEFLSKKFNLVNLLPTGSWPEFLEGLFANHDLITLPLSPDETSSLLVHQISRSPDCEQPFSWLKFRSYFLRLLEKKLTSMTFLRFEFLFLFWAAQLPLLLATHSRKRLC